MNIAKILPLKEIFTAILTVAVTSITSLGFKQSTTTVVCCSIIILMVVLFIQYRSNKEKREKAIAETLAYGYFMNFILKFSNNLLLDQKNHFTVNIDGKSEDQYYLLDNIEVQIILPENKTKLQQTAKKYNERKLYRVQVQSIKDKDAFWFRAELLGDKIRITDYPRTLFSLENMYSLENKKEYTEGMSKKQYGYFNQKIKQLIQQNTENQVLQHFDIRSN
ncbi:hypothetical protein K5X82_00590 [Halosquirtibacter xylanolyticus]|uniref:STING domain-containing protein n=1 Tax=Halosquirtibacter xylanolyticus TaxID=3374599 RepID=UPI0037482B99|nr:hypothetical protein K5X82_00590 [Prolixibacteraceae bacterium]